jgi:hypothetical protein
MPLYCIDDGGRTCRAGRITLEGTLNTPVSLTPARIPPPPNTDVPGCTSLSTLAQWTVRKFLYLRTGGGRFNDTYFVLSRSLELEIRNDANNFTQSCVITDSAIDGPNDKWFRCFPEAAHVFSQHEIETYVQFNVDTSRFAINQTWYCNDTEAGTPYVHILPFSPVL